MKPRDTLVLLKQKSIIYYVTLSHLRSKAQAVVHNLCTTLVVNQNIHTIPTAIHTIPTAIHHHQQQNKPRTTLECN